jgi:endonuclease YncB( thermonuclease family)
MKQLLLGLLLISSSVLSEEYDYKILRVIDGDTLMIEAPFLPKPLKPEISLRISGVDTPEKDFRAQCDRENKLAHDASEFTKNLINNSKNYKIIILGQDKYFRLLGDIMIDGKLLSKELITHNLAIEYHGDKKSNWCKI